MPPSKIIQHTSQLSDRVSVQQRTFFCALDGSSKKSPPYFPSSMSSSKRSRFCQYGSRYTTLAKGFPRSAAPAKKGC
jgi:hypothetical protein